MLLANRLSFVAPAKAGAQNPCSRARIWPLDPGFRRDDDQQSGATTAVQGFANSITRCQGGLLATNCTNCDELSRMSADCSRYPSCSFVSIRAIRGKDPACSEPCLNQGDNSPVHTIQSGLVSFFGFRLRWDEGREAVSRRLCRCKTKVDRPALAGHPARPAGR